MNSLRNIADFQTKKSRTSQPPASVTGFVLLHVDFFAGRKDFKRRGAGNSACSRLFRRLSWTKPSPRAGAESRLQPGLTLLKKSCPAAGGQRMALPHHCS